MTEYHLDRDFDGLGYAYCNDNFPSVDKDTAGCIALWCSIIEEAFYGSIDSLRAWVRSRDFPFVCELAGMNPLVLRGAADKLARGEIALRPKQNANKRYTGEGKQ